VEGNEGLEIFDKSGTGPSVWVVALVPINTIGLLALGGVHIQHHVSYNVFLPAILGCVAQDPPSIMLCLSSKKSADQELVRNTDTEVSTQPVYAGYSFIGSKPSYRANGELVHSHTPPISLCPASLFPLPVTATGCQCLKPTLAPARFVKSSCEPPLVCGSRDGGVSSTPLLIRCLKRVRYRY